MMLKIQTIHLLLVVWEQILTILKSVSLGSYQRTTQSRTPASKTEYMQQSLCEIKTGFTLSVSKRGTQSQLYVLSWPKHPSASDENRLLPPQGTS